MSLRGVLIKTTPRNKRTQNKIKKEELDELRESSASSFSSFQLKEYDDFRAVNKARTKQIRIKSVAYFRYIWYTMFGSLEVII